MGGSGIAGTMCKFLSLVGRGKLDQSSPESLRTSFRPVPIIVPNFIAHDIPETCYNFFTHLWILTPLGNHLGQSSPILELMYSKARFINVPNFVPFWHICAWYLLPKFVDFVDSMTDKQNVSSYHLATVSKIHVVVTVYCVNYFRQLTYRVKESMHLNRPTVEPNRIRKNNGRRVSINDENCGQPTGNKWAMRRNSTHVLQLGELHPPSMLLWIFLLYCCWLSCHKFDVWQIFFVSSTF